MNNKQLFLILINGVNAAFGVDRVRKILKEAHSEYMSSKIEPKNADELNKFKASACAHKLCGTSTESDIRIKSRFFQKICETTRRKFGLGEELGDNDTERLMIKEEATKIHNARTTLE